MTHRNTRRGNTQKAVNNNRHSRMSLSGIPSTADKQGGDPRLQASGMTASWITTRGFTLIELLVVVLIIGILATVALPQYQKAVLKSRFNSLMPTAKAIRDGQEAYYLMHSGYANDPADLDVTTMDNADMTITTSGDIEYAYTKATRPNIKNNLIMYQKHSVNYPGEIHCEAEQDNTQAEWLCKTALHATQDLGEGLTPGYTEYVIEGTGRGMTPAQTEAATGPCASARAAGATTCETTKNTQDNTSTKKVCYSIKSENDYCITTEYDSNDKQTKRTVCTATNICFEYIYEDGKVTTYLQCNPAIEGVCQKYTSVKYYEYDGDRMKAERGCSGIYVGKNGTCAAYNSAHEYEYIGDKMIDRYCNNNSTDYSSGKCTNIPASITESVSSGGQKITGGYCEEFFNMDFNSNTCSTYEKGYEYGYDGAGNLTSEKTCTGSNVKATGGCIQYETGKEYVYDDEGHRISSRTCSEYDEQGNCLSWGAYGYATSL